MQPENFCHDKHNHSAFRVALDWRFCVSNQMDGRQQKQEPTCIDSSRFCLQLCHFCRSVDSIKLFLYRRLSAIHGGKLYVALDYRYHHQSIHQTFLVEQRHAQVFHSSRIRSNDPCYMSCGDCQLFSLLDSIIIRNLCSVHRKHFVWL